MQTDQLLGKLGMLMAAYGSHTKYIRMGAHSPDNVEFDTTGEKLVQGTLPNNA